MKLSDGTTAFENGILKEPEEKIRQYIKMVLLSHSLNDSEVTMKCFIVLFCIFVVYMALMDFDGLKIIDFEWPEKGP